MAWSPCPRRIRGAAGARRRARCPARAVRCRPRRLGGRQRYPVTTQPAGRLQQGQEACRSEHHQDAVHGHGHGVTCWRLREALRWRAMIETPLGGLLGGAFRLAPEILKWTAALIACVRCIYTSMHTGLLQLSKRLYNASHCFADYLSCLEAAQESRPQS